MMSTAAERLTPRQRQILAFIETEVRDRGRPPTVREIGASFGSTSPNGPTSHLRALRAGGFVDWEEGKNRSIRVLRGSGSVPAPDQPPVGRVVRSGDLRVFEAGKLEAYGRCLLIRFDCDADVLAAVRAGAAKFT